MSQLFLCKPLGDGHNGFHHRAAARTQLPVAPGQLPSIGNRRSQQPAWHALP
jgi:hypothetical protein